MASESFGRPLGADEVIEPQEAARDAEHLLRHAVRNQVLAASAARDLTGQIDAADRGGEREVEAVGQRSGIPNEAQAFRGLRG